MIAKIPFPLSLRAFIGVTLLLLCFSWYQELIRFPFNHDNGAILEISRRVLDGEVLYKEFPEPNPPLIILFANVVSSVSSMFGFDKMLTWRLFFLLLSTCVVAFAAYILLKSDVDFSKARDQGFLWLLIALIFPYSGYDFSQREHLAAVFLIPFLLLSSARVQEKSIPFISAVAAGILAGIGVSFKPFFLLVFFFIQLYLFDARQNAHRTWIFPESISLFLTAGGFLVWVVCGTWYLQGIVFLQPFYTAYNLPLYWICFNFNLFPFYLAVILHTIFEPPAHEKSLRQVLFIGAAAFTISFIIQAKGFNYHSLPSRIFSLSLLYLILSSFGDTSPTNKKEIREAAKYIGSYCFLAPVFFIALVSVSTFIQPWEAELGNETAEFISQIQDLGPGKRVHVLTTQCTPIFPAFNYCGLQTTQRNVSMIIAKLYGYQDTFDGPFSYEIGSNSQQAAQLFTNMTVEDIASRTPDYIFSDENPIRQGLGASRFNFIEFLSRDSRFKDIFEKSYRFFRKTPRYRIFKKIE